MPTSRLSFKEMCARYDVTPRTLRYYEYIELLSPDREGREKEGTAAQMQAWVELADRQMKELAEQRRQLDETMGELQRLRDETAASLG